MNSFLKNEYDLFILVIPLAAEDHLLQWLDTKLIKIAKEDAALKWLHLLRMIYAPLSETKKEQAEANGSDENTNLIDVDIFDDTEPNTFDETVYTSHKCYNFMIGHLDNVTLDAKKKEEILSEFSTLQNL